MTWLVLRILKKLSSLPWKNRNHYRNYTNLTIIKFCVNSSAHHFSWLVSKIYLQWKKMSRFLLNNNSNNNFLLSKKKEREIKIKHNAKKVSGKMCIVIIVILLNVFCCCLCWYFHFFYSTTLTSTNSITQ